MGGNTLKLSGRRFGHLRIFGLKDIHKGTRAGTVSATAESDAQRWRRILSASCQITQQVAVPAALRLRMVSMLVAKQRRKYVC